MLTLFKNVEVFAPEPLGRKDILISGERIVEIDEGIDESAVRSLSGDVFDLGEAYAIPGFVDGHVHLIGGGGEGGFSTRTPEGSSQQFAEVGTTTVVGMLGTDGVTRDHASLLAKVRDFRNSGIDSYMLTGSYRYPLKTLTGDVMRDIVFIPEIIGVGEVAVSDHRSSNLSSTELQRFAMDARVAGMLSGKAGVTVLHLGDGQEKLKPLYEAVADGTLNPRQIIPTHICRSEELLSQGIDWVSNKGGYIDITADEQSTHLVLKDIYSKKIRFDRICVSSDGLGSLPRFDDEKNLVGIRPAPVDTLLKTFTRLVKGRGLPIHEALKPFTANPAAFYHLQRNGIGLLKRGGSANILFIDRDFQIVEVISSGRSVLEKRR